MTVDRLLEKWLGKEGGAERANYQMFLTELCQALGVGTPEPKGSGLGNYEFEAPVRSEAALGTKGTGRIDLYKRGHFILEAKQTQVKEGQALPEDPPEGPLEPTYDLFGNVVALAAPKGTGAPRYDQLMAKARVQAERYALALPDDHDTPPFLIVADIGRAFELYFDWSGTGRGYGFFPDQQNYRIRLEDLRSAQKLRSLDRTPSEVLQAIWTDPASIDPRARAAEVTQDIAIRLSRVAEHLEQEQRKARPGQINTELALGIEATSLFLMRVLFCMFAEDVELLPRESFKRFLEDAKDRSEHFWRNGLHDLWAKMNDPQELNRYWSYGDAIVRYFNGNLFAAAQVFDLSPEFKGELLVAAGKDWRAVEPAIFGTLLEQVLTSEDRSRFGAHYTPRAYVERLVNVTIMEVLEPEWQSVRDKAQIAFEAGDGDAALAVVRAFHDQLYTLAILDPACGTGNFLYVAMEQLLRLESEAIQLAAEFGDKIEPAVHPNQFLGLELNPRAAVIAELVLWIGWLRHRLANLPDSIGEPVLPPLSNINGGTHGGYDAVLIRTETGEPDIDNPRRPPWPEADFIVGNPPFIGKGAAMRTTLGDTYMRAMWKANPQIPKSADFVMQWWDRAADILTTPGTRLKRFGLVTTNSINQVFSRRVIERHLADPSMPEESEPRLSLVLAIADHPWTRVTPDAAAVRIAMTVAEGGVHDGCLVEITGESDLDTDDPKLEERHSFGRINSDLTIGTDVNLATQLLANAGISTNGMLLAGRGFVVDESKMRQLISADGKDASEVIRPYVSGAELVNSPRNRYAIDLFGVSEPQARRDFPATYQHLLEKVKPVRDLNPRPSYRSRWWVFAEPRSEIRPAFSGLNRYIATTETTKHRVFRFLDTAIIPDHMLIAIASDSYSHFGILSSNLHLEWTYANAGLLGVARFEQGHRYTKSVIFDTFPFPASESSAVPEIAEELDVTRKTVLAENEKLTMTGLYNFVQAVRLGSLTADEEAAATRVRARIVAKLHDDLDQAVADAYGWGEEWRRAPLPPAEIVARLVALNKQRAAEESEGKIRWLRPEYQAVKFAKARGH